MLRSIKEKGFTLIEVVVVLGIIAVLSAILIPVTANYLSEAKIAKAKRDCQTIANAIQQFQKDTGEWPRWLSGADQGVTGLEDPRYVVLHSIDGDKAELAKVMAGDTNVDPDAGADIAWNTNALDDVEDNGTADGHGDSLDHQLNTNGPGYPTAGHFRAWRGPYLPDLKADPWGNKYYVNVKFLSGEVGRKAPVPAGTAGTTPAVDHAAADQGRHAFVLSAGPNEIIETEMDQKDEVVSGASAVLKIGGDDIVVEIK